jgi:hypothetical protein
VWLVEARKHAELVPLRVGKDNPSHLTGGGVGLADMDGLDFYVLGEPTAEHREAVSGVRGAQFHETPREHVAGRRIG